MNMVKELVKRVEARFAETKNPCKSYSSEERAEKVATQIAQEVANYFNRNKPNETARPMRYLVVYIPSMQRWVIGFDMSELINRASSTGGYLGICGEHFTF